ncbi:MAG TPA: peptidoglycan DD-metalloendopeptidase family protein [Smithella sp.]|nr:peptidoglycan DD-metalloendopeptidase family protein [Smithella sp.]
MGKINSPWTPAVLILLALSLVVSCFNPQIQKNQPAGVYHLVKKNETLPLIAQAYGVRLKDLVKANNITDVKSVRAGSVVFIPNANQPIENVVKSVKAKKTAAHAGAEKHATEPVKDSARIKEAKEAAKEKMAIASEASVDESPQEASPAVPETEAKPSKIADRIDTAPGVTKPDKKNESKTSAQMPAPKEKMPRDKNRFIWPVRGSVKNNFGIQPDKTYHNWIKIVSPAGTKVKAAAAGTVIFSSDLKNYGETVIVRHKDNFATVYTHLKKRYVRIDQDVKKGETIAMLGEKDDAGLAYINFEIRFQGKARNPLSFLP